MLRKTLTILSLIGLLLSVGLWGVSVLRGGPTIWLIESSVMTKKIPVLGFDPSTGRFLIHIAHGDFWKLPLWGIAVALGIYPLWYFLHVDRLLRKQRKKLGLCLTCGYNLKGLTEPRCPECNTQFESHD